MNSNEIIAEKCNVIEELLIAMLDSGSISDANAEVILTEVNDIREEI